MLRYKGWIAGSVTLFAILGLAVQPEAGTDAVVSQREFALSPSAPILLNGCASIETRERLEREDCLQSARLGLIAGELTLDQAIATVRNCAALRPELALLVQKSAALAEDRIRAALVFGGPVSLIELSPEDRQRLRNEAARVPAEYVAQLSAAGITSAGISGSSQSTISSLRRDASLRRAFRAVFGETTAADLDLLLTGSPSDYRPAVVIGSSVIVPSSGSSDPGATLPAVLDARSSEPQIISEEAYAQRVRAELRALEAARLRYLRSAAEENQQIGSVPAFLGSVRTPGGDAPGAAAYASVTARDRGITERRVELLEQRLGLHPLLGRAAEESVGTSGVIASACRESATNRKQMIALGAASLAGMIGAAGVVVATGATGTTLGGLIIALALEGSVGAYFFARSDGLGIPSVTSRGRAVMLAGENVRRRAVTAGSESTEGVPDTTALAAAADDSAIEEWFLDEGLASEWDDIEGQGVEGEGLEGEGDESDVLADAAEEATDPGPRQNTIAPVLPAALPPGAAELPPILENQELRNLSELTLPEIRERMEQFLAVRDPSALTSFAANQEELVPSTLEEMIEEATSALRLWETSRVLSDGFGRFFIQAEAEKLAPRQRPEMLARAMNRYAYDQQVYSASRNVDDLRDKVAQRLVAHCRSGPARGDLVLTTCAPNATALSMVLIAAMRDAGVAAPPGSVVGIQSFDQGFDAVLYDRLQNEVFSLTKGERTLGVVAPIYYPATFYYSYLVAHSIIPEIDADQHLLIALPDRANPATSSDNDPCADRRSIAGKVVDVLIGLVGLHRMGPCEGDGSGGEGGENDGGSGGKPRINVAMPIPGNPFQGGGGQSGGGMGGGSGSGGGMSMTPGSSSPNADGGSDGGSQPGAGGGAAGGAGQSAAGSETGEGEGKGTGGSAASGSSAGDKSAGDTPPRQGGGAEPGTQPVFAGFGSGQEGSSSSGGGGTGGFSGGFNGHGGTPDLLDVAYEASLLTAQFRTGPELLVAPWRLREDEGVMAGSSSRVLFADNQRALSRFADEDVFITLTPAEVEAQRRMLEADIFVIYPAGTTCDSEGLPPRRVFRRAAPSAEGFRYVYCDQDESSVVFRNRSDAERYAGLIPPDRPLMLASLATRRLENFAASAPVQRLQAFLEDPNVLRGYTKDEIYAMAKAASDLLVFQNALESMLVQSMEEMGESSLKGYYYESWYKPVIQSDFFVDMASEVYRLNQRLNSDPLQSLAWANAQPDLAKQGFFDIYHTVGEMMSLPDRWAAQQDRYGNSSSNAPARDSGDQSNDFLQILSDPVRVQVDWHAELTSRPAISDQHLQRGVERTNEVRTEPTDATRVTRQDEDERRRGGTKGGGRAGEGTSRGPESGDRRILQTINFRVSPGYGTPPERKAQTEVNTVKPGGTEGMKRVQTERSATRQEPILWVSPSTFIQGMLSTWDNDYRSPAESSRIPPVLRFNERLREVFLRTMKPEQVYDNRLRSAMNVFSDGGWLRYQEVREAMGGSWVSVRARDTGRFSAAYSGNPPIYDQDQIAIPNFFTRTGVVLPADLFDPVREHYTRSILGIFELTRSDDVSLPATLRSLPLGASEQARQGRDSLIRTLELIREQATEEP